ncbi:hypothetical protein NPIL_537351, partial [Nephila pilipes]
MPEEKTHRIGTKNVHGFNRPYANPNQEPGTTRTAKPPNLYQQLQNDSRTSSSKGTSHR